jgi:KDO2-lipid IV(A) lauroyltransferase
MPESLLHVLTAAAGTVAWLALSQRRRIVLENLAYLAPELPHRQRRRMARRTFVNLAQVVAENFVLPSRERSRILRLFRCEGEEHLARAVQDGRGAILVTAHLGPYELAGAWLAAKGYKVCAMFEELDVDTMAALDTYRQATGMKMVTTATPLRELYRILDDGHVLVLVADRTVPGVRGSLLVPFGTAWRPVPLGPARLAAATSRPIVVGYCTSDRERRTRYLARIEPPVYPDSAEAAAVERLARTVACRLETAIRAHPDEWYVFQPQWTARAEN